MNDISMKSREYQSLETLLNQKNPSIRFQQYKERELKELLEAQSNVVLQTLQPTIPEKSTNINEKLRSGSSLKMAGQFITLIRRLRFAFDCSRSTINITIERLKFVFFFFTFLFSHE